jgi:hypothetical protein
MDLDFSRNMEMRVLLLAIYKQENDDTLKDTMIAMENNRLFTAKDGKKMLKELRIKNYLIDNRITMIGIEKAKEVELEFKV